MTGAQRPGKVSPIFLAIFAVFAGSGVLLGQFTDFEAIGTRLTTFVFVASGWLVSLCLHEFGHAYLAYRSGDRSVAGRGYLTLDPRKYSDMALSFALPMIFLILGGIGLPGGAVYINQAAIPSKARRSLISAAGPVANVLFAIGLGLLLGALTGKIPGALFAALAFLAFLQVTAAVLNLLPVPGLDGFGILEPWLPPRWTERSRDWSTFAFIGVIALLWFPPLNAAFFEAVYQLCEMIGIDSIAAGGGRELFQFWSGNI